MGVVIHATRLMQPGEFALWGNGKLVASGLLGSRLETTAFDAVALHVDDSAVLCLRLVTAPETPAAYLAPSPDGGSMSQPMEVMHVAGPDRTRAGRRTVNHR
jgi:hypothetical protein